MKRIFIIIFVTIFMVLLLSGCGKYEEARTEDDSSAIEAAEEAAKKYLIDNQDNMEALAAELIKLEMAGQHLQYYPVKNELYEFGNESYHPSRQLEEHNILDLAEFMSSNGTFFLVSPSKGTYEVPAEHCEYLKAVNDETGELMCYVELIYCPNSFEENEYAVLEKVLPNWFLYIWPCD